MINAPTPRTSRANREARPSSRRVKLTPRAGIQETEGVQHPPRRVVMTVGVSTAPSTTNPAARKYPVSLPNWRARKGTTRLSPAIPARTTARITAHTARARRPRPDRRPRWGRGVSKDWLDRDRLAHHTCPAGSGPHLRPVDISSLRSVVSRRTVRPSPRGTTTQVGAARSRGVMIPGPEVLGAGSGTRTRTPSRADAFEASMSAYSIIPAGRNYCTGLPFFLSERRPGRVGGDSGE